MKSSFACIWIRILTNRLLRINYLWIILRREYIHTILCQPSREKGWFGGILWLGCLSTWTNSMGFVFKKKNSMCLDNFQDTIHYVMHVLHIKSLYVPLSILFSKYIVYVYMHTLLVFQIQLCISKYRIVVAW